MTPLHEGTIKRLIDKLLFEAVQDNRIITSIKNRQINKIYYQGEGTQRPGYRSIEVYCFGVDYSGNPVIRAWQREGVSDTPYGDGHDKLKEKPGWRLFRLDGIKSFNNTNLKFDATDNYLRSNRPRYNAHDKAMQSIYYALEPDGKGSEPGPVDTSIAPEKEGQVQAPQAPPIGSDKPLNPVATKPLFKSDDQNPLFGSERDEEEKNSRN